MRYRSFRLPMTLLLLLGCASCAVIPEFRSGCAKARIQKEFLHKSVQLERASVLVESVADSGTAMPNLYDEQGKPTQYVWPSLYWLVRLFRTPDYRIRDFEFYNMSRYPQRVYGLVPDVGQTFKRQVIVNVWEDNGERLTTGPLAIYPLEKGWSVYVERMYSYWSYTEFSFVTVELPHVALKMRVPGTDREVEVECSVDDFDKLTTAAP